MTCPTSFSAKFLAGPACWEAGHYTVTVLSVSVILAFLTFVLTWRRKPKPAGPERKSGAGYRSRGIEPVRSVLGRKADLKRLDRVMANGPLARLWRRLRSGEKASRPPFALISGQGGLGKTTLAHLWATTRAKRFHGIVALRAESPVEGLAQLADDLQLPRFETDGPRELARRALSQIEEDGRRWLLLYDNADGLMEDSATAAELRRWLPNRGRAQVIATTRDGDWRDERWREVPLSRLAQEPAADLLQATADPKEAPGDRPRRAERDGALRLAAELDGLPLGLVMAGTELHDAPGQSFADFAANIEALLSSETPRDYPRPEGVPPSLEAVLGLSLDRCAEDETALLDLFAHLAPEGLTADLLDPERMTNLDFKAEIPGPLAALVADAARRERALAALVRRSLLAEDAGEGHALHRLTATVVRRRLAPAKDATEAAAAVLAARYPTGANGPANFQSWPACARLTPHVLALYALPEAERPATRATHFLFNQAAIYLRHQDDLPAARALAESSLELTQAIQGPDHRETGASHAQLGGILLDLGDLDGAERHRRRALEISTALGAAAEADRPIHLNNLASVLEDRAAAARAAGDPAAACAVAAEAQGLYREALALDRAAAGQAETEGDAEALAHWRILEASRLNNLATLNAAAGRPRRAAALAAAAVAVWERTGLPPDDPRHAIHRNTLGGLLLTLCDPAAARPHLARALAIREDKLPSGHPHIRTTAVWLAACLFALDPPETDAAKALCARQGLDPDERRARAARLMADAPRRKA